MATASKFNQIQWSTYLGGTTTFIITRGDGVQHKITYICGELSGVVCDLTTSLLIDFVVPLELAAANKNGSSVTCRYTLTSYANGEEIGSETRIGEYKIPEDIKPTCMVSVTDGNGLLAKYGAYVQSKSKLRIVTTPTLAYDSPISSYKIAVDGGVYTLADVVTSEIKSAGEIPISATVTDARGRSGSDSASVSAIAYTPPAVVSFTSERVNADGSDNEQGDYIKVTFSAAVTPLNNRNSAVYKLEYKKSADSFYTEISVSDQNGKYSPTNISRIFAADTGSSYDVRLTITDDFHTTVYSNKAQSGFTTFHVPASGNGFSFGKVSEIEGLFDVAFRARFLGGFMKPEIEAGADFNDITVPNTYACADAATAGYLNCPTDEGTLTLDVFETCNGNIAQKAIVLYSTEKIGTAYRCRINGVWGKWVQAVETGGITAEDADQILDNNTWDLISAAARAGIASSIWSIGDCKAVSVSGKVGTLTVSETLYAYIIGFDHNGANNTIDFGTFKTASDGGKNVCFVDEYYGSASTDGIKKFNMNHSTQTNSGGWKGCDIRYDVLGSTDEKGGDASETTATKPVYDTLMAALPADLRKVMKPMTIYTDNVGGGTDSGSNVTESIDYLPLLAEFEIFGVRTSANSSEQYYQKQYAYFEAGNSKIKYKHNATGSTAYWWERSAFAGSTYNFCLMLANNTATDGSSRYPRGIAPIFRV